MRATRLRISANAQYAKLMYMCVGGIAWLAPQVFGAQLRGMVSK